MRKIIFLIYNHIPHSRVTKRWICWPIRDKHKLYSNFGEDNDYSINAPSFTNNGQRNHNRYRNRIMWQQADGMNMTIETAYAYADNLVLGFRTDCQHQEKVFRFWIIRILILPLNTTTILQNTNAGYWWTNTYQTGDNSQSATNAVVELAKPKSETISAGGTSKFHARGLRYYNACGYPKSFYR
jgi:hypothetical protein